jgi:putative effector of murein hydrolase LrgA (UPF0299 family)
MMKFKIGIAIITFSFLGSLIPYWLVFTIPAFTIGAVVLWLSKKKTWIKVAWTTLPVALWYPSFMLFMYLDGTIGIARAQKIDFIFSEDFKGRAVLVGSIPCGQGVSLKNEREQVFVPDNGVILYQGEIEFGYINHKYYQKTKSGGLIELPKRANYMYFDDEENPPPTDVPGVWLRGSGIRKVNVPKPQIEYQTMDLVVGSKDSLDKYYDFHYLKNFENLTDSLVRSCELSK